MNQDMVGTSNLVTRVWLCTPIASFVKAVSNPAQYRAADSRRRLDSAKPARNRVPTTSAVIHELTLIDELMMPFWHLGEIDNQRYRAYG
jgi:hypothetical protein